MDRAGALARSAPSSSARRRAPMRCSMSPDRVAGLVGLRAASPAPCTVPPVTAAAARNGAALDRSGSMRHVDARAIGPGATTQRFGPESSTATPRARSIATVISMCGRQGTGRPVVPHVEPLGDSGRRRAAARRRTGSTRTRPCHRPATEAGVAVQRERQCSSASSSIRGADRRQRGEDRAHRAAVGLLVAVEGRPAPPASAATGGRKRITVPASPQSTVPPGGELLRRVHLPLVTGLGDLARRALAARRASARCHALPARR